MPRSNPFATAAVCSFVALPAAADLTAEEVWADLQAYTTSFGYEVTGQTSRDGQNLIVTDMQLNPPQLSDENTGTMTIDQIVFRELGDGSVAIDVPSVMPIEMTTAVEGGEAATIKMDYTQTGLDIVATGNPDNILYTYSADTLALRSNQILINGLSDDTAQPVINFELQGLAGTTDMSIESQRQYDQIVNATKAIYTVNISDPSSGESVDMQGEMNDISFSGLTSLPLRSVSAADMDAMLAAGFTVDGTFAFESSSLEMVGKGGGEEFASMFTSQAGDLSVEMNANKLSYNASQSEVDVQMSSSQFPIPLTLGIAQSGFEIAMPVRQSEDPQDFAFGFNLNGVKVSDAIWSMFDPTSTLPRDPAAIVLQLDGRAKLLFDFLNPDLEAMQSFDGSPVELEQVDVNKLQLSIAGAELSGTGEFEFKTTALGVPQPIGAIDLTLVGGNALIDGLVSIGLLPEQQAMGARMMLGLLAVPGGEPDTLNSKIEINEMGHISANGQRIQ